MLATPKPGTLGDLLAKAAERHQREIEELTELVVQAYNLLSPPLGDVNLNWVRVDDPTDWLERAAVIVGEAT